MSLAGSSVGHLQSEYGTVGSAQTNKSAFSVDANEWVCNFSI